jgi:hypothetical protein
VPEETAGASAVFSGTRRSVRADSEGRKRCWCALSGEPCTVNKQEALRDVLGHGRVARGDAVVP